MPLRLFALPVQKSFKQLRLQVEGQGILYGRQVPVVESVDLQHHRLNGRLPLAVAAHEPGIWSGRQVGVATGSRSKLTSSPSRDLKPVHLE